jgi:hypothetical protein
MYAMAKMSPLKLSKNMRYIHTEYLHPSVQASLNRSARKPIDGFRPVGLNPEQALEVKLLAERDSKK